MSGQNEAQVELYNRIDEVIRDMIENPEYDLTPIDVVGTLQYIAIDMHKSSEGGELHR